MFCLSLAWGGLSRLVLVFALLSGAMDYGEDPIHWAALKRAIGQFHTRSPCFLKNDELEAILRLRLKAQTSNDNLVGDYCFKALAAAGVALRDRTGKWVCKDGREGDLPKLTPEILKAIEAQTTAKAVEDIPPPSSASEAAAQPPEAKKAKRADPPTRVVLLTNMVGRDEVDEDLEEETTEEAGKYGRLAACKIVEILGVSEEESVRIFLDYKKEEAAVKCHSTMDGRFFGGRRVRARFYDVESYSKGDLMKGLPPGARAGAVIGAATKRTPNRDLL